MAVSNLGRLSVGSKARVLRLQANASAFRRKLLSMGVIPGTRVEVMRMAPLGDPIEIELSGYRLCLRRHEAAAVDVEVEACAEN